MRYIILFQHSCAACSKVAQAVRAVPVTGLEARPLEDPEVAGLLGRAGVQVPDRPSLLIADGDGLEVLSGWAMRRRLASVIGWRRSGAIAGLLTAEWRARMTRSADSHAPSRRGVIGGALAGAVGWALTSRSAFASPRSPADHQEVATAEPKEIRAALETVPGQQALRTWGAVGDQAYRVGGGRQTTLMLTHPRDGILTFIGMSPGILRPSDPAAVSLGKVPGPENAIRYYSVGGTPLADLTVSGGRGIASHVPLDAVVPGRAAVAEPDISARGIACFVACTGRRAGAPCIINCITCATGIAIKHPPFLACAQCTACAGQFGVACVAECGL